jgi:hypothetical protein
MSKFYKLSQDLAARKDLTGNDKLIYAIIRNCICISGKDYSPIGTRRLADMSGLGSRNTVLKAVQELEDYKLIVVKRRNNGESNLYYLPESGSESEPVQKLDRFRNCTATGSESEPEPVQKVSHIGRREFKRTIESQSLEKTIVEYWNSKGNLPKVLTLSKGRKSHLAARLKEPEFRDRWKEVIDLIAKSSFLTGHNDRNWRATFDWVIKNADNYLKILEGRYSNKADTGTDSGLVETVGLDELEPERQAAILEAAGFNL